MHRHTGSLRPFLEEVARRDSRVGGGSAAALAVALAAALVEKLAPDRRMARRLGRVRRACLGFVTEDAARFAEVLTARRAASRRPFVQALRAATEVPFRVQAHAHDIEAACLALRRKVPSKFRSDLTCAAALAHAGAASAQALIEANLSWMSDPTYARRVRRRLKKTVARSRLRPETLSDW